MLEAGVHRICDVVVGLTSTLDGVLIVFEDGKGYLRNNAR